MALTDRKLIREEISALFDSISAIQENLDHPPITIEGKSPVVSIHADGTLANMVAKNTNEFDHFFRVTIYVNREAHGSADAEDKLDEIYTAIMQEIRDQVTGTNYMELTAAPSRSLPAFQTIDGAPYRVEEVIVVARSNPSG